MNVENERRAKRARGANGKRWEGIIYQQSSITLKSILYFIYYKYKY